MTKVPESGSGSLPGYTVEAKVESFNPTKPLVIRDGAGDMVLSKDWTQLSFFIAPPGQGVPVDNKEAEYYVYNYESAVALASTVVAQHRHSSISVRIVPFRIKYTWEKEQSGKPKVIGNGIWHTSGYRVKK